MINIDKDTQIKISKRRFKILPSSSINLSKILNIRFQFQASLQIRIFIHLLWYPRILHSSITLRVILIIHLESAQIFISQSWEVIQHWSCQIIKWSLSSLSILIAKIHHWLGCLINWFGFTIKCKIVKTQILTLLICYIQYEDRLEVDLLHLNFENNATYLCLNFQNFRSFGLAGWPYAVKYLSKALFGNLKCYRIWYFYSIEQMNYC